MNTNCDDCERADPYSRKGKCLHDDDGGYDPDKIRVGCSLFLHSSTIGKLKLCNHPVSREEQEEHEVLFVTNVKCDVSTKVQKACKKAGITITDKAGVQRILAEIFEVEWPQTSTRKWKRRFDRSSLPLLLWLV